MSIYSNVTEQDLINLRKLAEQQKNQRDEKIKNKIVKQTHDVKLAESFSPITIKLVETSKKLGGVIEESTQNLANVIKDNNTPQLALENTPTTQQPIEITPTSHQPIENNEGVIYDAELENTLQNMENNNTGFFKTHHDSQQGWLINKHPIKLIRGTEVEINKNKYNITTGIQKVFTDTSYNTAKSMSDTEKVVFRDNLQKTDYYKRLPTKGRLSGRDSDITYELDNEVSRILNLNTKLKGRGVEKIFIPSNIIDIYTRIEVLLGLKISGHNDTLTEASNLIDDLYKRGEIQKKQQYGNAPNKFLTQ